MVYKLFTITDNVGMEPSRTELTNIVIAEDHPIYSIALAEHIAKEYPRAHIESAPSAGKTLDLVKQFHPELLILDLRLQDTNNALLDMNTQLRQFPNTKILVLSMHESAMWARQCFRLGANGFIPKSASPSEIIFGLKQVMVGSNYDGSKATSPEAFFELSPREIEVLDYICQGQSSKEIAAHLELSVRTIESHRTNLMRKLGAKNTPDLVARVMQSGSSDFYRMGKSNNPN